MHIWKVEVQLYSFLTSTLDAGEFQIHATAVLSPVKNARVGTRNRCG